MNQAKDLAGRLSFAAVTDADFERLNAIRVAAMRTSLEAIGRFDPERARARLRNSFYPGHTRLIVLDGEAVGFYTLRPLAETLYLDHFYIQPASQSLGIGSHVMGRFIAESEAVRFPIALTALRGSASNRFYQRHGFVRQREEEWDIHYLRAV